MICILESRSPYVGKYKQILDLNGIAWQDLSLQDPDFWIKVRNAHLFICYLQMGTAQLLRQQYLISVIDRVLHVPCYPDWNTAWHYDDKNAGYYLLRSCGHPIVESQLFWDQNEALCWAREAEYPQVFKLKNGAGSINVIKVDNQHHAARLIDRMFGKGIVNNRVTGSRPWSVYGTDPVRYLASRVEFWLDRLGVRYGSNSNWSRERGYAYFQKFISNNDCDIRINVIGDATFGFRRFNRAGDFRSSGGGDYDLEPGNIPFEAVRTAQRISREMGFQSMAYDFLIDQDGRPLITEIGCQSAGRAIPLCPGYWDWDLNWHAGHYWPQYVQLKHLLGKENLVQPDFN